MFSFIKSLGCLGVDIFLFVSGISLYFSMMKNGENKKQFYIRRLQRVWLPSLLVSIPWFLAIDIYKGGGVGSFILSTTGLALFVNGNRTIWFVSVISFCYVLYPWVYNLLKKHKWSAKVLLVILSVNIIINIVLRFVFPIFWTNTEIFWRRIPIFIIGAYVGKIVYEKKKIDVSSLYIIAITIALTVVYYFISRYMIEYQRYLFIPLAISYTSLFSCIGNCKVLQKVGTWFAPITLEIYLTHEKIIIVVTKLFPMFNDIVINLTALLCSVICAYVLLRIEKIILCLLSKKNVL